MNFLGLRSNRTAAPGPAPAPEIHKEENHPLKRTATLEGLIALDPLPDSMLTGSQNGENEGYNYDNGSFEHLNGRSDSHVDGSHIYVAEDEGWIAIPYKELPTDWSEAPDISSFRSMDRSFVFPGEQVHILACFSPSKQDMEIITPFKVAAVMNKNGIGSSPNKQNTSVGCDGEDANLNSPSRTQVDSQNCISDSESLLRKEDRRRHIEALLHSFNHSHFFVRIAESDEQLWSKRGASQATLDSSEVAEKFNIGGSENMSARKSLCAIVDKGNIHSSNTGGLARNAIKCHSLSNGDIVVLLQINVGVDLLNSPVLEILQFQKHQDKGLTRESHGRNFLNVDHDPCGELLRWLLPLDNSIPPPSRPLSPPPPPQLSSSSSIRSTSIKPSASGSSGSQMFSFSNFRSYSMSSFPQNNSPAPPVTVTSSRPNFEIDDRDQFSFQKSESGQKSQNEGLLSFRGVSLEPERFSVRCGLEGIYTPGRRWRKKIEIVRPVDIHSFSADCNTDDLVCVQIKNVSPPHAPDIVVYIDAITLVYEEASSVGPPLCFPIACIEAGDEQSLPNLELRRGEEHSFILKPSVSLWKVTKSYTQKGSQKSNLPSGNAASSWHHNSYTELKQNVSSADHFAILVSCRCNYTESRLFFKQPTSWRPRISRELMISVASQMSRQTLGSDGRVAQLPVQVLTLQASNLTSEDLTLTVLAPASFTSPPSVLSLSSSPSSPLSPLFNASFFTNVNTTSSISAGHNQTSVLDHVQRSEGGLQSISLTEQDFSISDFLPNSDVGCTHLWLQSRVPLGCVPSQSTATVKLEVLPLTDGIITLDSLQIDVKEKGYKEAAYILDSRPRPNVVKNIMGGITYVPEHSLKINATSSVTTGVV